MRRSHLWFSAALGAAVLFMFSCSGGGFLGCNAACDPNQHQEIPGWCGVAGAAAGGLGGPCYGDGHITSCDDGLTCSDNVCIPCGAPGEACCETADRQLECDQGGTCSYNSSVGAGMCDGTCGTVAGGPCCGDGTCSPSAGSCGPNKTCGTVAGKCSGTGTPYSFWAIDPAGCAIQAFNVFADSTADAQTCAQGLVDPGWTIGPINQTPPIYQQVCAECSIDGNFSMQIAAFTSAALTSCEHELHPSCTYVNGNCP
jgi:hypothetical protein